MNRIPLKRHLIKGAVKYDFTLHFDGSRLNYMVLEVSWDSLWTLSFGLSQFHGHGSWLACEVALTLPSQDESSTFPSQLPPMHDYTKYDI